MDAGSESGEKNRGFVSAYDVQSGEFLWRFYIVPSDNPDENQSEAMKMAADQVLRLMVDRGGFTMDEAYSLASVAVDLGVTQVVDGTVGCHAGVALDLIG